jgi:hypothetical protein
VGAAEMLVGSLAVLFVVLVSPPPETVAVFVILFVPMGAVDLIWTLRINELVLLPTYWK